jgi:hypothetical protein
MSNCEAFGGLVTDALSYLPRLHRHTTTASDRPWGNMRPFWYTDERNQTGGLSSDLQIGRSQTEHM